MPRFRKKPVVIEARQFVGSNADALVRWIGGRAYVSRLEHAPIPVVIVIPTWEGDVSAQVGDWIIKGVKGEFYPIKDEIFRQTYEAVDDAAR